MVSIITIILAGVTVCSYLLCYLMGVLYGWEMVYPCVFLLPIFMYCRNNQRYQLGLWITTSVALIARIVILTLIGTYHSELIVRPLSMEQDIVRQYCGVVTVYGWFIWFIVCGVMSIMSINDTCKNIHVFSKLDNNNGDFHKDLNVLGVTTAFIIVAQVTAIVGYSLRSVAINVVVQDGIIVILYITASWIQTDIIRRRKEKLIEDMKRIGNNNNESQNGNKESVNQGD